MDALLEAKKSTARTAEIICDNLQEEESLGALSELTMSVLDEYVSAREARQDNFSRKELPTAIRLAVACVYQAWRHETYHHGGTMACFLEQASSKLEGIKMQPASLRRMVRNLRKTTCPNGHDATMDKNGVYRCKTCLTKWEAAGEETFKQQVMKEAKELIKESELPWGLYNGAGRQFEALGDETVEKHDPETLAKVLLMQSWAAHHAGDTSEIEAKIDLEEDVLKEFPPPAPDVRMPRPTGEKKKEDGKNKEEKEEEKRIVDVVVKAMPAFFKEMEMDPIDPEIASTLISNLASAMGPLFESVTLTNKASVVAYALGFLEGGRRGLPSSIARALDTSLSMVRKSLLRAMVLEGIEEKITDANVLAFLEKRGITPESWAAFRA